MAAAGQAIVDWSRAIRPIWGERLALVAIRRGADVDLPAAWRRAVVECRATGWQICAIAPLEQDPMGHRWALVLGREERFTPHLALIHGLTASDALAKAVTAMRAGLTVS